MYKRMCAGCLKKRSPVFFGTPCGCIVGQICMIVLSYRLIFMENCIDRLVQGVSKRSRLFWDNLPMYTMYLNWALEQSNKNTLKKKNIHYLDIVHQFLYHNKHHIGRNLHVIILSLLITYRPVCVSQTDQSVCVKQTGLFVSNRPVCLQPVYIVIKTGLFVTSLYSNTGRSVWTKSI